MDFLCQHRDGVPEPPPSHVGSVQVGIKKPGAMETSSAPFGYPVLLAPVKLGLDAYIHHFVHTVDEAG